jgi:hypothetical protein
MFRFELVIDLLVEFLVCAGRLCGVEVAAADDVDAVVLEIESGGDVFEAAQGQVLLVGSDPCVPIERDAAREDRRQCLRNLGSALPTYPLHLCGRRFYA